MLKHIKDKYPQGEIEVSVKVNREFFNHLVSVWDGQYKPLKKRNGYDEVLEK